MQGPETRQSLLLQLQDSNHQQAWCDFVGLYEPLIYRIARSMGCQHADALDLSQDVLAKVSQKIAEFDRHPSKGSFRGWLSRITRNLVLNHLSRQRQPRGVGGTEMLNILREQPKHDACFQTQFELTYKRELFRLAAQRVEKTVSKSTWTAFWLTGVLGKSNNKAAQELGLSVGSIRVARCRVLAKLRNEVRRCTEMFEE